ncbi:hypothetical protein AG0111_0g8656 [Alternaria gaisen]|uniref:Uncharacterized protein n=1 Tax=Alternaria gaisen TaxID=167740 RepID=A0ACB6FFY7_9PLEO|nr:hypothetical protein AG0111_0g8656 [Alternaria gaisen]
MVGGIGYMSRDLGLSIDVLLELEVVLANGTVVRANKDQHQDLFWAMRGAGASFRTATEFGFQTKPKPSEITTLSYNYTTEDLSVLSNAVKKFQQMMADESMPRKLTASATVTRNSVYISGAFFGSRKDFDSIELNNRFPETKEKRLKEGVAWIQYMENLFQSAGAIPNQAYLYARDTAVVDNPSLREDS